MKNWKTVLAGLFIFCLLICAPLAVFAEEDIGLVCLAGFAAVRQFVGRQRLFGKPGEMDAGRRKPFAAVPVRRHVGVCAGQSL